MVTHGAGSPDASAAPFASVTHPIGKRTIDLLCCPTLAANRVPHGFSFRYRSLGGGAFGVRSDGEEDRRALAAALGIESLAYMKQVHGNRVVDTDTDGEVGECDGVVSVADSTGLIVHTADCVPVLFWESRSNRVAACHAGWRGTRAGVAERTARRLLDHVGSSGEGLHAVLGPSIRQCCFEVGDEVPQAFLDAGYDVDRLVERRGGRAHVDLLLANRLQLNAAGVPEAQIYDSSRCTRCENERFYSYRAEGAGVGRVMSVIASRPGGSPE